MDGETKIKMGYPEQLGFLDDHAHFLAGRYLHHVNTPCHFSFAGHQGQYPSVGKNPGLYPPFSAGLSAGAFVLWVYPGTIPVLLGKRKEIGEIFDEAL